MADHRKSFRPRRLAFGGRLLPRAAIFAASLALLAAFSSVSAQEAGLRNGAASLAAGKYDAAVRQLSATINSENASRNDAAQALYLRGNAYRKMGESARAAADLGAAIWLGLSETDRVKAMVNRGLAYQVAGLGKEGAAEIAAARKLGGSGAVDQLIAEGGGTPAEQRGNRRLQHRSAPRRIRVPPAPGRGPKHRRASTPASAARRRRRLHHPHGQRFARHMEHFGSRRVAASPEQLWRQSAHALVRLSERLVRVGTRSPAGRLRLPRAAGRSAGPARAATLRRSGSDHRLVDHHRCAGSFRRRQSARREEPLVAHVRPRRLKRRLRPNRRPRRLPAEATSFSSPPAAPKPRRRRCGNRCRARKACSAMQPQIERVEIGSFGTFYALRIGPFPDKAESQKVCNALKRNGIDCSPAEQ